MKSASQPVEELNGPDRFSGKIPDGGFLNNDACHCTGSATESHNTDEVRKERFTSTESSSASTKAQTSFAVSQTSVEQSLGAFVPRVTSCAIEMYYVAGSPQMTKDSLVFVHCEGAWRFFNSVQHNTTTTTEAPTETEQGIVRAYQEAANKTLPGAMRVEDIRRQFPFYPFVTVLATYREYDYFGHKLVVKCSQIDQNIHATQVILTHAWADTKTLSSLEQLLARHGPIERVAQMADAKEILRRFAKADAANPYIHKDEKTLAYPEWRYPSALLSRDGPISWWISLPEEEPSCSDEETEEVD